MEDFLKVWNFKDHSKLRSKHEIGLSCVTTCVLFNRQKTTGNAVGKGLDLVFRELRA